MPEDATLASSSICQTVLNFNRSRLQDLGQSSLSEDQHAYLDALALFEIYSETHPVNIKYELPKLGMDSEKNSKDIVAFFEKLNGQLNELFVKQKLSTFRNQYSAQFNKTVAYEFNEAEQDRVRKAIHELREFIRSLEAMDEGHKTRLLNRLGHIHEELELKQPDVDRIWGLLGEAIIVRSKYGRSGKAIVKLLYEIANTAWQAQARAEAIAAKNIRRMLRFL